MDPYDWVWFAAIIGGLLWVALWPASRYPETKEDE